MGSGYVRQSAASIASGQSVASAPVNAEFNQLQSAFSGGSGHGHDGTTGNGPLLTSTSFGILATTPGIVVTTGTLGAFTSATITGTSGKITVTNGTGAAGNPTITIDATYIGQNTITTLGTISTGVWQGTPVGILYGGTGATTATGTGSVVLSANPILTGTLTAAAISATSVSTGSLVASGNSVLTGNLAVGGVATIATGNITGNATVGGTLGVTGTAALGGNTSVTGTLSVSGTSTLAAITASTGAFSGNVSVTGTLGVSGVTTLAGMTSTGINSSPIGQSSAAAGSFTSLSASSTLSVSATSTLAGLTSTGINNSPIGQTTPAAGAFTTLSASSTLSVTGASTLAVVSATTGAFSSNITVAGTSALTGNVGVGSSASGTYALNVVQAGTNQAYFGSTGSNPSNIYINNAAGGSNSAIILSDAGTQKWSLQKDTSNRFLLFDLVSSKAYINATTSGNLTLGPAQTTTISQTGVVSFGSHSIGTSGYTQSTDGLILQWTTGANSGSLGGTANASQTINFPVTFPNAVLQVFPSMQVGSPALISCTLLGTPSTSSCVINVVNQSSTGPFSGTPVIFAIGN